MPSIRQSAAILLAFSALLAISGGVLLAQQTHNTELLGGPTTIYNDTQNAFTFPAPGIDRHQRLLFFVGDSFFNQNWVIAPASTTARDGIGPLFASRSCAGCHFKDGRGRAPDFDGEAPTGFVVLLNTLERDLTGAYMGDPIYGGQFHSRSIEGVPAEGDIRIEYTEIPGEFADGTPYSLRQPTVYLENLAYGDLHPEITTSYRVANQVIGLGLLEAIPEETLLALSDPNDSDDDGISGRPNYVWDHHNSRQAIGRFGWKANQPHLLQQVAAAFHGDMSITTSLFPAENCGPTQTDCATSVNGGEPEIVDDDLLKVALYMQSIAVPAQRNADDPQVMRGAEMFRVAQCTGCHIETLTTGIHPTVPALSNVTFHPYTDLLLHDMGEGLADNSPDFEATGTEWRTPPLWGIGLFETVNGHTNYLHDGRARNLTEAILWHGGEAEASRDAFIEMDKVDREALLAFLNSL